MTILDNPGFASARGRRIRRFCQAMQALVLIVLILLPLAAIAYWFSAPSSDLTRVLGAAAMTPDAFDFGLRLMTFPFYIAPLALMTWGLMRLRRFFTELAAGRLFSRRGIAGLRDFAIATAITAVIAPFTETLMQGIVAIRVPEGMRTMAFTISSDNLLALLFASTFAIICWVMSEAAELADEHAQIV